MANREQNAGRGDRPHALWCVEQKLRAENFDLDFYLVGQAHYGQSGFAFIEVYGIDDQIVRRWIRKEAGERLERLGFPVELIDTKDVFHVTAIPPDDGEA
jgi:ribonucleotide reductase beta subunit family protein with ferritin-like domain